MSSVHGLIARRLRTQSNSGFTLIEVILAMFIVAVVMVSLIGVLISSLSTVTHARQRQTATALATQALERLRALPYDEVTQQAAGAYDAGLEYVSTVGGVVRFQPAAVLPGVDEELVVNTRSGRVQNQTVDGVTYKIQTYVTQPAATPAGQQMFNLTALVSWSSSVTHGTRTTAQRSVTYSPAGCLSTAQSPFAAPCQAYFTAQAGTVLGGISVANALDSTQPIEGFTSGTLLDLTLSGVGSTLLVEQTASATANAQTAGARSDGGGSGGQIAVAAVDSDPSSVEGQSDDSSTPGQTSAAQSVSGPAGSLTLRPSTADSGRASAAIQAPGTICTGASGTALTTGPAAALRPCSSSRVTPNGGDASLEWTPPSGTALPLARVTESGSAWRSVAANLTVPNAGACSSTTTLGCAHAAATRSYADVMVGGIGTPVAYPAGWNTTTNPEALVRLIGFSESARAEDGTGVAAPAYSRSGALVVWDGTSNQVISLATAPAQTITVPATSFEYPGSLFVTYEGSVSLQPAQVERTPATRTGDAIADCKAEACVTRVNGGGGVVVNLTVTITNAPYDPVSVAPPLGRFTMGMNLGGLVAQASYKAAPNA